MIISGELPVGTQIPSGAQMKRQWGVNRLTGAMAVEEMRKAGLVVTKPGVGTFVATTPDRQLVRLYPGDQVIARMPTEEERELLCTGYLTPVLVIIQGRRPGRAYNAAVTVLMSPGGADTGRARAEAPEDARGRTEARLPGHG